MGYVNLIVSTDEVRFELSFDRRINFIVGDSGIGKTYLYNLLNSARTDSDIRVKSTYDYVLTSYDSIYLLIKESKDKIIIIDDIDVIRGKKFSQHIKNFCVVNNLWFVIMSREDDADLEGSNRLSFSIDSIYTLQAHGNIYRNVGYYSVIPVDYSNYDIIVTEDVKAGFIFFDKLSGGKAIPSTAGESTVCQCIKSLLMNDENQVIIAAIDCAAFGCHIYEFYSYFSSYNVSYIPILECFEELLLQTNALKSLEPAATELASLPVYANQFVSWESYFEDLISRTTNNKMYHHLHSRDLPECYTEPCDICAKQKRDKCNFAIKNGDKFADLLAHTKYNDLLKLR